MTDEDIDKILSGASQATSRVDPALLKRIADSINTSLQPVRPLPSPRVLTGGLALVWALLAVTLAARAGFYGIEKLDLWKSALILSTLGTLVWVAAKAFVSQLVPGSHQPVGVLAMLISIIGVLLGVFSLVFRDYRTDRFISAGIVCLATGVLVAIPAAMLSWLLLRRGFAVNSVTAGLAGGVLAGLCGVTMLELHCSNFLALHVLVWHTAVVPFSAAAGALVGWVVRGRDTY